MSPANAEWHTFVRKLLDGPIVATMVDYRLSCTLRSFTGPALVDQLSVMASSMDGPMDTSIAVLYGVWVKVGFESGVGLGSMKFFSIGGHTNAAMDTSMGKAMIDHGL